MIVVRVIHRGQGREHARDRDTDRGPVAVDTHPVPVPVPGRVPVPAATNPEKATRNIIPVPVRAADITRNRQIAEDPCVPQNIGPKML